MFMYVIGGAVVAALLVALANYRQSAKKNTTAGEISVDNDEFDSPGNVASDDDAPTAAVTALTDDNWEDLLLKTKSNLPIVIEFHTTWCPGCKAQAPIFARAAAKYASKARFFSADCDEFDHLARVGGVKKIPTTFFIEPTSKTQIVHVGLVELGDFATKLEELGTQAASGNHIVDADHPYLFD